MLQLLGFDNPANTLRQQIMMRFNEFLQMLNRETMKRSNYEQYAFVYSTIPDIVLVSDTTKTVEYLEEGTRKWLNVDHENEIGIDRKPLLDELLKRWKRRYTRRRPSWDDVALF